MLPGEKEKPRKEIKLFGVTISIPAGDDGDDNNKAKDDKKPVDRDEKSSTSTGNEVTKGKEKTESSHQEWRDNESLMETKKQKKKKRESVSGEFGLVPPWFHPDILGAIRLHRVKKPPALLFRKRLEIEDVNIISNRLLITFEPHQQLATRLFVKLGGDFVRHIARDAGGREYQLRLKKSTVDTEYHLVHEWNEAIALNGLQVGDTVEGWGSCLGNQIRMALLIFRK